MAKLLNFAWNVKRKARYAFEDHVDDFLQVVIATSNERKHILPTGQILWRAQLGHEWENVRQDDHEFEVPAPFPPERMKPLSDSAYEGRANAKGIPCLYLATDKETAMSEVRPWLGAYLSVAQFEVVKDIVLVDCSVKSTRTGIHFFKEPPPSERAEVVWSHINRAFSEPVNPNDTTADYAPTQILAESFRKHGYDGVVYKSLLGEGLNVVHSILVLLIF